MNTPLFSPIYSNPNVQESCSFLRCTTHFFDFGQTAYRVQNIRPTHVEVHDKNRDAYEKPKFIGVMLRVIGIMTVILPAIMLIGLILYRRVNNFIIPNGRENGNLPRHQDRNPPNNNPPRNQDRNPPNNNPPRNQERNPYNINQYKDARREAPRFSFDQIQEMRENDIRNASKPFGYKPNDFQNTAFANLSPSVLQNNFASVYDLSGTPHNAHTYFRDEEPSIISNYAPNYAKPVQSSVQNNIPTQPVKVQSTSAHVEEEECSVCFDVLEPLTSKKVVQLVCDHQFHQTCINQWLATNKDTCPMCRKEIYASQIKVLPLKK